MPTALTTRKNKGKARAEPEKVTAALPLGKQLAHTGSSTLALQIWATLMAQTKRSETELSRVSLRSYRGEHTSTKSLARARVDMCRCRTAKWPSCGKGSSTVSCLWLLAGPGSPRAHDRLLDVGQAFNPTGSGNGPLGAPAADQPRFRWIIERRGSALSGAWLLEGVLAGDCTRMAGRGQAQVSFQKSGGSISN